MSPGISLNKIVIPFRKLFNAIPNGSCTLLTATTYSATRINLAWTNGSTNEDGISIERSDDGITFAEVDTVGAGVTVYADTPLAEATQYWYRVRAYRGAVPLYSDYSNTADDMTWVTALTVAGTVEQATPTRVDIMFGWNLDGASVPATTAFAIAGKTITNVAVAGGTVSLTVSVGYDWGDTVNDCVYTMPATNRLLRDSDGAEVTSFTQAVTNNIDYPVVINDANHWWYDATDLTTITKDGSNYVSALNSKGGQTGRNLLQSTGSYQPLWVNPGIIRFDGTDNEMATDAFTWNQPAIIYILMNQVTWTLSDGILDGVGAICRLYQNASTPEIKQYAGSAGNADGNLAVNTWGIVRVLFNGASSFIKVNAEAATVSNPGTNNPGGLIIGGIRGAGQFGNIEFHTIVCADITDAANETEIYNWLVTRIP